MSRVTYDPEKFNLSVARLKKGGHTFELVIDPDAAILYKEKKLQEVKDVLKYEKIFADAQRGQLAAESLFENIFEQKDTLSIAKIILDKGTIHLTAEFRKKQLDKKRKQIIGLIHRYGVDPRTGAPHTAVRIDSALTESKIKIDEFKSPEIQVKDILKKLKLLLPIRFENKEMEIFIPAKHAYAGYTYIKSGFTILKDTWDSTGNWVGILEIPGGLEDDFLDMINKVTHGTVQTKVLKHR